MVCYGLFTQFGLSGENGLMMADPGLGGVGDANISVSCHVSWGVVGS
jgi:hypothetical protein